MSRAGVDGRSAFCLFGTGCGLLSWPVVLLSHHCACCLVHARTVLNACPCPLGPRRWSGFAVLWQLLLGFSTVFAAGLHGVSCWARAYHPALAMTEWLPCQCSTLHKRSGLRPGSGVLRPVYQLLLLHLRRVRQDAGAHVPGCCEVAQHCIYLP